MTPHAIIRQLGWSDCGIEHLHDYAVVLLLAAIIVVPLARHSRLAAEYSDAVEPARISQAHKAKNFDVARRNLNTICAANVAQDTEASS
jgi:hypothetical protein